VQGHAIQHPLDIQALVEKEIQVTLDDVIPCNPVPYHEMLDLQKKRNLVNTIKSKMHPVP
jgi:hypothetical protein